MIFLFLNTNFYISFFVSTQSHEAREEDNKQEEKEKKQTDGRREPPFTIFLRRIQNNLKIMLDII
jgi:hypothetical protein